MATRNWDDELKELGTLLESKEIEQDEYDIARSVLVRAKWAARSEVIAPPQSVQAPIAATFGPEFLTMQSNIADEKNTGRKMRQGLGQLKFRVPQHVSDDELWLSVAHWSEMLTSKSVTAGGGKQMDYDVQDVYSKFVAVCTLEFGANDSLTPLMRARKKAALDSIKSWMLTIHDLATLVEGDPPVHSYHLGYAGFVQLACTWLTKTNKHKYMNNFLAISAEWWLKGKCDVIGAMQEAEKKGGKDTADDVPDEVTTARSATANRGGHGNGGGAQTRNQPRGGGRGGSRGGRGGGGFNNNHIYRANAGLLNPPGFRNRGGYRF
jgi:hypothetical protein